MIQPLYVLRYLYGGVDSFDEDIALTYEDYADLVARWDTSIDASPPTALDYSAVETLMDDAYFNLNEARDLVETQKEGLNSALPLSVMTLDNTSRIIENQEKERLLNFLTKDEVDFDYLFTEFGQSSLFLDGSYFPYFINYTDLVDLFNVYSYEQLIDYGYEWLYTVGQFLGETFTQQEALIMLETVLLQEINPFNNLDAHNLTEANLKSKKLNLAYQYRFYFEHEIDIVDTSFKIEIPRSSGTFVDGGYIIELDIIPKAVVAITDSENFWGSLKSSHVFASGVAVTDNSIYEFLGSNWDSPAAQDTFDGTNLVIELTIPSPLLSNVFIQISINLIVFQQEVDVNNILVSSS